MSSLRQALELTAINLRSIPQRVGSSAVICIGIAGVVAVLTTVLAMATGLRTAYASAARVDRAIVTSSGAHSEEISFLSREDVAAIRSVPGIRRTADGGPAVSAELLLQVNMPRRGAPGNGTETVRGLTPVAADVRPEIHLTAGRMFTAGVREIIVGKAAHDQFEHLELGESARFYNGDWLVVGLYESGGDLHESEVLTDAETLMSASHRSAFSATTLTLESPMGFDALSQALLHNPALNVDVQRETDYYGQRSEQAGKLVEIVATTVAAVMAVGALFGALNVMYSTVSTRAVEIATMRAIGFGAAPVVAAVLIEAQLLALIGGTLGAAVAWIAFNGEAFNTGGVFGQVAGRLHINASLIAAGMAWATAIGFVGGLFPALHAARMSVTDALSVG